MLLDMRRSATQPYLDNYPFAHSIKRPREHKSASRSISLSGNERHGNPNRKRNTDLDQNYGGKFGSTEFSREISYEKYDVNRVIVDDFVRDDVISDDGIVLDDDSDNLSDVEFNSFDCYPDRCRDTASPGESDGIDQLPFANCQFSPSSNKQSKNFNPSRQIDLKNLKTSPERKSNSNLLQSPSSQKEMKYHHQHHQHHHHRHHHQHSIFSKLKQDEEKLLNFLSSNTQFCNELSKCSGCKRKILDRFVLKVQDRPWHVECLKCEACHAPLTTSCFSRGNSVYCKEDFLKKFRSKCAACGEMIPPSAIVRRANNNVYHLDCFRCSVCKMKMSTGDKFYLLEDLKIVCQTDYDETKLSETTAENNVENNCKRPRTTINAQQLEMLKDAYNQSSKPTRHVREQLSSDTGLDIRVVQVWFQNRRAKEKRMKKEVYKNTLEEHDTSTLVLTEHDTAIQQSFTFNSEKWRRQKRFALSTTSLLSATSPSQLNQPIRKPLSTHNDPTQDVRLLNPNQNQSSFGFPSVRNGVASNGNFNPSNNFQDSGPSLNHHQATVSTPIQSNSKTGDFDFQFSQPYEAYQLGIAPKNESMLSLDGAMSASSCFEPNAPANLGGQIPHAIKPINNELSGPVYGTSDISSSITASCSPVSNHDFSDNLNRIYLLNEVNSPAVQSTWYEEEPDFYQF